MCRLEAHSIHVTSINWADTFICHTTVHRNVINVLYIPGHVMLWCVKVVPVVYAGDLIPWKNTSELAWVGGCCLHMSAGGLKLNPQRRNQLICLLKSPKVIFRLLEKFTTCNTFHLRSQLIDLIESCQRSIWYTESIYNANAGLIFKEVSILLVYTSQHIMYMQTNVLSTSRCILYKGRATLCTEKVNHKCV